MSADNIALRAGMVLLVAGIVLVAFVGTPAAVAAIVGLCLLALSQAL